MAEEKSTMIMRVNVGSHNVWLIFNNTEEKLWGKRNMTREQLLGIFASKFPVYRPLTRFKGIARQSEAIMTLCDYELDEKQDA